MCPIAVPILWSGQVMDSATTKLFQYQQQNYDYDYCLHRCRSVLHIWQPRSLRSVRLFGGVTLNHFVVSFLAWMVPCFWHDTVKNDFPLAISQPPQIPVFLFAVVEQPDQVPSLHVTHHWRSVNHHVVLHRDTRSESRCNDLVEIVVLFHHITVAV